MFDSLVRSRSGAAPLTPTRPAASLRPRLARRLAAALIVTAGLAFGTLSPADAATTGPATTVAHVPGTPGIAVGSSATIDWSKVKADGDEFAYIEATQGTSYASTNFAAQFKGAGDAGLIRGAAHFAIPSDSTGAAQADYFVAHGGDWTNDGMTLPGALDIEYNPYGAECYGLSPSSMVSWISSFVNEYHARTGRWAVIYTTAGWWTTCTGDSTSLTANDPLWISNLGGGSTPGTLPGDWPTWTFWQYGDSGPFGDQETFNGTLSALQALASGS